MAFQRLAPHSGLAPLYGSNALGTSALRGGFSWASLGTSIGNAFHRTGQFLGHTAHRIGSSQAFQQAKRGFLDSGVINSAAALAGDAVNSLVDIGRLKMESDLNRLREKAMGRPAEQPVAEPPPQTWDLQQYEEFLRWKKAMAEAAPTPTPVPFTFNAPALNAVNYPASRPIAPPRHRPPPHKRRKRGWGQVLDNLTGSGIQSKVQRYCA